MPSEVVPFDFSLISNSSSSVLLQGESTYVKIDVTQTNGTSEDVNLFSMMDKSDSADYGIICDFNPSYGIGNFSSVAKLTILNSTSSNAYMVNFTAVSQSVNHTLSFNVDVLSAYVPVSGEIILPSVNYPAQIGIRSITIIDSKTNQTVRQDTEAVNSYYATLKNHNTYFVTVSYVYSSFFDLLPKSGEWSTTLYVDAAVGQTALTKSISFSNYSVG